MNEYHEKDNFGNRIKAYERESESTLDLSKPIIARIDGKRFSKFTKGMMKPFDHRMSHCMANTTLALMDNLHADVGYTQSDEITLVFLPKKDSGNVVIPFNGRVQKATSIFAAMATAEFIREYDFIRESVEKMGDGSPFFIEGANPFKHGVTPYFDCRVFNAPNAGEASNVVLWRIQDAIKNAISCAYRWNLGHKSMQNLSGKEMVAGMEANGIDFYNVYEDSIRSGMVYLKVPIVRINDKGEEYTRGAISRFSGIDFSKKTFEERVVMFGGEVQ